MEEIDMKGKNRGVKTRGVWKRDAKQKSPRMVAMENPFWLTTQAIQSNVQVQPLPSHIYTVTVQCFFEM
nr:hypothetical protein Iba_chr03bCG12070 [Ipomoea batatas]GMC74615.1 hypothetical protein Iba_chr03cCG11740 [Ipomoea batatas]